MIKLELIRDYWNKSQNDTDNLFTNCKQINETEN